jgi:acetyl-CoA carboxylase carboxyl transferase subunit alpha
MGICDEIIPEAVGGAHRGLTVTAAAVKDAVVNHLSVLAKLSTEKRLQLRYEKYRRIGHLEKASPSD